MFCLPSGRGRSAVHREGRREDGPYEETHGSCQRGGRDRVGDEAMEERGRRGRRWRLLEAGGQG